MNGTHVEG